MTWIQEQKLREFGNLREFANLRKQRTGLPVNIWVDDSMSYIQGQHSKRIKFQLNYRDTINSRDNSEMGCMDLKGNVIESTLRGKNIEIDSNDIRQVSNFVKNNRYALYFMSDMKIDILDFCEVLIKGGQVATDREKLIQIDAVDTLCIQINSFASKEELEKYQNKLNENFKEDTLINF